MPYISRIIEENILRFLREDTPPYHVLLLSGARQCGKSTLLKHLFPPEQHIHINFALDGGLCDAMDATQDFRDFTLLLENRLAYRMGEKKILIFDEAQLSKKIGGYVRFMKEEWKTQRVILTGSTLATLFENREKPVGRVVEFVLRPFNFLEFLDALGKRALLEKVKQWSPENPFSETVHAEAVKLLENYLRIGGLPEVVLTHANEKDPLPLLANLFAFYKRDFQEKLSDENLTAIFQQIFLRIAAATGSPITLSSIIKSSSPGYRKLPFALSILESWHQILRVDCETSKLSKVGTVTPKRYIFDHGIRMLQNPGRYGAVDLTDTGMPQREELGGLIENFVLTELLSLGSPFPIRSWGKTHQSGLVDFIFQKGQKCFAIEVKAATRFDFKHLSALSAYREFYPETKLILANLDRGNVVRKGNFEVVNIPVYALFSRFAA